MIRTDPELDEIVRKAMEGLEASGNAEGVTEEQARRIIAERFNKYGGKEYDVGDVSFSDERFFDEYGEPQAAEPRVLRIPEPVEKPYWYEDPEDAEFIEHHVMSRRALGKRIHGGLLITGPAGQGKTLGVGHAIDRINEKHGLSLNLLVMHCPTITDEQKWFGRREIDKSGSRYEVSDFIVGVERGDVILLDEVKRLHPRYHNPIMGLLNGTEEVLLSDLNITIRRHPETVFIATTNEGAVFGGNHRMDYAMEERWPFRLERTFPPEEEEVRILVTNNPPITEQSAQKLVGIATATRGMWATGDLRVPISTRTLDSAAFLVASGYTEREAMEYTALGLYDAGADGMVNDLSEREQVRQAIEGRTKR